jgi:hypothetical protein
MGPDRFATGGMHRGGLDLTTLALSAIAVAALLRPVVLPLHAVGWFVAVIVGSIPLAAAST